MWPQTQQKNLPIWIKQTHFNLNSSLTFVNHQLSWTTTINKTTNSSSMNTLLTLNPLKPQPHFFKLTNFKTFNQISNQRCLISTISCKISSNQQSKDGINKKVVVPGAAPPVLEEIEAPAMAEEEIFRRKKSGGGFMKRVSKRVLAVLANLPLAIGEMFAIAALMALGMCFFFSQI